MARAAWAAPGSPAASSRAPGRSRASGRAAGSRRARSPAIAAGCGDQGRGQAGRRPRRPRSPPLQPSGAATRSPGRENAAMTFPAAAGGDRPGARPVRAAARGGQVRPDAQRHAGTCPAGLGAAGLGAVPAWDGWHCRPGAVVRVWHGGWSRVPPLSPLTFTEIGFAGPFFTRPQKNLRLTEIAGMRSGKIFLRQPGSGGGPLPDGMYLPCTCGGPAMYLARERAGQRRN